MAKWGPGVNQLDTSQTGDGKKTGFNKVKDSIADIYSKLNRLRTVDFSEQEPTDYIENVRYYDPSEGDRIFQSGQWSTPANVVMAESTGYGVIEGLTVSAQNTPDMSVNVEGGIVHMMSGKRFVIAAIAALAILAADPLLPRIDRIYTNSSGQIAYAQGTAAASPVAPELPGGSAKGYQVSVAAGTTSITNAALTDERIIKPNFANLGIINVKDLGAKGDGVTDDTDAILLAVKYAKATKRPIWVPAGTYLISKSIENLTNDALASNPVMNGIQMIGQGRSITAIKASSTFPATSAVINLDGNIDAHATVAEGAVAQNFNAIKDITVDCNNIATRGIRLRAIAYSLFDHVYIKNSAGGANDASFIIASAATEGNDDVDTTYNCTFNHLAISGSTGFGFAGFHNRIGSFVFNDCDIRDCTYDGMSISFASLTLNNCTFAGNGSSGTSTGGFKAAQSATKAVNRGLVMNNCSFESNYNYEFNIDNCYGFNITGGLLTPYVRATSGQVLAKIGGGTVPYSEVDGGAIQGMRIAAYSSTSATIGGLNAGAYARNIDFKNNSFDGVSDCWSTQDKQFTISPFASAITKDGYSISKHQQKPAFSLYAVTSASVVVNVTGDGTEYKLTDHEPGNTTIVDYNDGPIRKRHYIEFAKLDGNVLTVQTITDATLQVGNRITYLSNGKPVSIPNTYITAFASGSGGTGSYTVNTSTSPATDYRAMYSWDSQWYDAQTGLFTAPHSGYYNFGAWWPCTGFGGTETDVEVALVVNPGGSQKRYLLFKDGISGLSSTAVKYWGGSRIIFLNAGDTVTSSVKVSGGTKVVDIYRNVDSGNAVVFSGTAL